MATKKSTAKKPPAHEPTQEEIAASVGKEREIHALQAEVGLGIARKLTDEVFEIVGGFANTEYANTVLEVYDLLTRDVEGEPLEDQAALKGDLTRARNIALDKLSAGTPKDVLEVYDRMFGSFDEALEDEEDDEE